MQLTKKKILPLLLILLFLGASSAEAFKIKYGTGIKVRGFNSSDINFTINSDEVHTILNNTNIIEDTLDDLNRITHYYVDYIKDYQLNVGFQTPAFTQVGFSSSNENIATVNSNGKVNYVSDGTVTITARATTSPFLKKRINLSVEYVEGGTTVDYPRYASDTLGENVSDIVDNRIADVNAGNAELKKNIFTTQDQANAIYVRNPDCWAYGLDLTSISPWNSQGGVHKAGTLISPRHIVFAHHYPIANGTTIRFVKQDNTVVDKTLVSSSRVLSSDLRVGILDSDVPEGITFAKVLPDGWEDKIPGITKKYIPILCLNQEEKALIHELKDFGNIVNIIYRGIHFWTPTDSQRLLLYEYLISGDSGNPAFMIVNNELIVLTVQTSGSGGYDIAHLKNAVNAVMTSLGGGYQLTEVDLSEFSSF